jgi:hypothetical protein
MFLYVSASFAYTPPLGIPTPTGGIDEVMPGRPEVWTSEVAGYYFIDRKSASKTVYGGDDCTNTSNTYGYLGHPRCDIPSTIKKGSRIEIYGEYDTNSVWNSDTGEGLAPNGNEWSANADGPAWVTMPNIEGTTHFFSAYIYPLSVSYLYFDGIYVKTGKLSGILSSGSPAGMDHVMVRNSYFDLNSLTQSAIQFDGYSAAISINNIIVYNNTITEAGNMLATEDADNGGISFGDYLSYGWILENTLSKISAVSLFVGGQANGDPQYQHHLYIGKNTVTDSNAFGMWSKHSSDTIFSENVISDIHDFPTANTGGLTYGSCMGGQYGLYRIWYINNKCSSTTSGARIAGSDGFTDFKVFFIGNTFNDISLDYMGSQVGEYNNETAYSAEAIVSYEGNYYTAKQSTTGNLPTNTTYWGSVLQYTGRPPAGIIYAGPGIFYAVNNTMYNVVQGIVSVSANVVSENNIISTINDSSGYYFWEKSGSATTVFKNNNVYGTNTKFRIYNTEYTDLADFIADTAYGDGSISIDPSFVSAPTNLRLNSGSGAIGAGIAAEDLTDVTIGETTYTDVYDAFFHLYGIDIKKDIAGTARPQQTTWDIGAYEYDPATVRSAMSIGAGAGVSIGSGATMTLY